MADETAPGQLEVLREFINTLNVETGRDELATPAGAFAWLRSHDLVPEDATVGDDDVEDLRALREAFRDLLHAEGHGEDDPDAREVLDAAVERARLRPRFAGGGGFRLEATTAGIDAATGRLLAVAIDAMADGSWQRLKVCDNDGCAWAFYDHSRNRSGRWCSMAVCGNRMKVKAYRERAASQ